MWSDLPPGAGIGDPQLSGRLNTAQLERDLMDMLRDHDEWMMQCEEEKYMDTGDALDQMHRLKSMCEQILDDIQREEL